MAGAHTVLVGKTEDKRPTERPGRGWKDNIKTDFKQKGW
jgi:hypothetical protein